MSAETSPAGEAGCSSAPDDKASLVKCPTCGRSDFGKPGDMKVHHYQAHGESIAEETVECAWCGKNKIVTAGEVARSNRFFCDNDCKSEWQSKEVCEQNHPSWDGGKVAVECDWCGAERRMYPSHAAGADHHFCPGTRCADFWRSENFSGEDSPRWRGGYRDYYGPSWRRQRRKARDRDNNTCQICGVAKDDIGRNMSVHHITPFRRFGVENHKEANALDNLISLCPSCHQRAEQFAPLLPDTR